MIASTEPAASWLEMINFASTRTAQLQHDPFLSCGIIISLLRLRAHTIWRRFNGWSNQPYGTCSVIILPSLGLVRVWLLKNRIKCILQLRWD